jgi:HEAT repeat protein
MSDNSPQNLRFLISCLDSEDHIVRAGAARELANLGEKASEAIEAMLRLASDEWYQVRLQVPRFIMNTHNMSDEAQHVLMLLANDTEESVNFYAKDVLEKLSLPV